MSCRLLVLVFLFSRSGGTFEWRRARDVNEVSFFTLLHFAEKETSMRVTNISGRCVLLVLITVGVSFYVIKNIPREKPGKRFT